MTPTHNAQEDETPTLGQVRFAQIVDTLTSRAGGGKSSKGARAGATAPAADGSAPATPSAALEQAQALVKGGQVDAGLTLGHQIWPSLAQLGGLAQMGLCQYVFVLGYQYKSMHRAAASAARRGIELFTKANDPGRALHLRALRALNLVKVGDLTEAFEILHKATQSIATLDCEPLALCQFWTNAAGAYAAADLIEESVACMEKGLALARLAQEPGMIATGEGNLIIARTVLASRGGHRPDIEPVYRELRSYADRMISEGRQHHVLALAYEGSGCLIAAERWDEARELLKLGRQATVAAGLGAGLAQIELRLAQVERQTGQLRRATVHIKAALELSASAEAPDVQESILLESFRLQEAQAHWHHALRSFQQYAAIRESRQSLATGARWKELAHLVSLQRQRLCADASREPVAPAPDIQGAATVFSHAEFERLVSRWRSSPEHGRPVLLLGAARRIGHADLPDRLSQAEVQRVGQLLASRLRPSDLVTLHHDHELLIALAAGTTLEESLSTATSLCDHLKSHGSSLHKAADSVAISFGISVWERAEDLNDALLRAEWALHDARSKPSVQVRAFW